MRVVHGRTLVAALLLLCGPGGGAALAVPSQRAQGAGTQASPLREAQAHLAAGRAAEALAVADRLLIVRPSDVGALRVKVEALVALARVEQAHAAYDAYFAATHAEDDETLVRLARGVLVELERAPTVEARIEALAVRARAGDAAARAAIEAVAKAVPPTTATWRATLALAALGDRAAIRRVVTTSGQGTGSGRVAGVDGLRHVPPADAVEALRSALRDTDTMVQATAAEVAAAHPMPQLRDDLLRVMRESRQGAPLWAAVALAKVGERAADPVIRSAVDGLPDGRLIAARALAGGADRLWVDKLRPLLEDNNALFRVLAAEQLLGPAPEAARPALVSALADVNPLIRAEAVRVLASEPTVDRALMRRALRDASADARLHAARALMRLGGAPAQPAPRGR